MIRRDELLTMYENGREMELMAYHFRVSVSTLIEELRQWKEDSKVKNTYTKEFKQAIANRDKNGISRTDIRNELGLHENSILKFCKEYGQARKEQKTEDIELFSYLQEGDLMSGCPKCKKPLNVLDEINQEYYCKTCGDEFQQTGTSIYRLNWEYVD